MTETFDLFALHQWETDGGPAFDEHEDSHGPVSGVLLEISRSGVAAYQAACLVNREAHSTQPKGATMSQVIASDAKDILIHAFHSDAECEYSGKVGEAVEISTSDGTIQHAVICIAELTKLLRFRHRQHEKQNSNGKATE